MSTIVITPLPSDPPTNHAQLVQNTAAVNNLATHFLLNGDVMAMDWSVFKDKLQQLTAYADRFVLAAPLLQAVEDAMPKSITLTTDWATLKTAVNTYVAAVGENSPEATIIQKRYTNVQHNAATVYRQIVTRQLATTDEQRGQDFFEVLGNAWYLAHTLHPDYSNIDELGDKVFVIFKDEAARLRDAVPYIPSAPEPINFKEAHNALTAAEQFLAAYGPKIVFGSMYKLNTSIIETIRSNFQKQHAAETERLGNAMRAQVQSAEPNYDKLQELWLAAKLVVPIQDNANIMELAGTMLTQARTEQATNFIAALPVNLTEVNTLAWQTHLTNVRAVLPEKSEALKAVESLFMEAIFKIEDAITDAVAASNRELAESLLTVLGVIDPDNEKFNDLKAAVNKLESIASKVDVLIQQAEADLGKKSWVNAYNSILDAFKLNPDHPALPGLADRYNNDKPKKQPRLELKKAAPVEQPSPEPVPAAPGAPAHPQVDTDHDTIPLRELAQQENNKPE